MYQNVVLRLKSSSAHLPVAQDVIRDLPLTFKSVVVKNIVHRTESIASRFTGRLHYLHISASDFSMAYLSTGLLHSLIPSMWLDFSVTG